MVGELLMGCALGFFCFLLPMSVRTRPMIVHYLQLSRAPWLVHVLRRSRAGRYICRAANESVPYTMIVRALCEELKKVEPVHFLPEDNVV